MLTKRSGNKQAFLLLILLPSIMLLLPVLIGELIRNGISGQGGLLLALSLMVQAGYGCFLSKSLEQGDMSQVYPMMRGLSAFLLPFIGIVFLHETLTAWGWIGLLCIAAGFFMTSGIASRMNRQAVPFRVVLYTAGVGLCTMSYVLIDKLNLQYYTPLMLLEVSNIGFALGLIPFVRMGELRKLFRGKDVLGIMALGSVLSPGSYLLFLLAMNLSSLAYIAPLREFGTVFGAFAGIYLLNERKEAVRLVSAGVIFAGILLIGIWGR
ncbi:ligand-binding protein SH3 [Cohnella fermenti]|uniref:Ligand-binding protein SH3 n=1 Tax=Cohnella fermenti TaxID=2565925 RepID=A0A4S4C8W2_9BACL|nr:DMT family transporter [Cohnella fermenti]THF84482.1 ligand-binding protein SH3 [Cohnella fermenti]